MNCINWTRRVATTIAFGAFAAGSVLLPVSASAAPIPQAAAMTSQTSCPYWSWCCHCHRIIDNGPILISHPG
ncbi:hypothetical protein AB0469_14420 [Streptomyces sp. NPDC093801]|uniref:hypothetical protein n=1 Tax=Streptomyces sp. NPDC093801 TaxID=3155203 RepID=UPI00344EF474